MLNRHGLWRTGGGSYLLVQFSLTNHEIFKPEPRRCSCQSCRVVLTSHDVYNKGLEIIGLKQLKFSIVSYNLCYENIVFLYGLGTWKTDDNTVFHKMLIWYLIPGWSFYKSKCHEPGGTMWPLIILSGSLHLIADHFRLVFVTCVVHSPETISAL